MVMSSQMEHEEILESVWREMEIDTSGFTFLC